MGINSFNRLNYIWLVIIKAFKESSSEYNGDILTNLQLAGTGKDKFDVNLVKMRNLRET